MEEDLSNIFRFMHCAVFLGNVVELAAVRGQQFSLQSFLAEVTGHGIEKPGQLPFFDQMGISMAVPHQCRDQDLALLVAAMTLQFLDFILTLLTHDAIGGSRNESKSSASQAGSCVRSFDYAC